MEEPTLTSARAGRGPHEPRWPRWSRGSRARSQDAAPAERGLLRSVRRHPFRTLAATLLLLVVASVLVGGWYVWSLERDYRETRAHVDAAKLAMNPPEGQQFQFSSLPTLMAELDAVEAGLARLQERMDVPVLSGLVRETPYLGERMRAVEDLVAFGLQTTALARDSVLLTQDVYGAYSETGLTGEVDPNAPTWLTVVQANRDLIDDLLLRFDGLLAQRAALDYDNLPQQGKNALNSIDSLLSRAGDVRTEYGGFLDYYPIVEQALAVNRDGRYLVMLNNSNEIRPSGGFPGTYALVSVSDGRLQDYSFHVITEFDVAYAERRPAELPAPAPISTFLLQPQLLPRDAGWSPDFGENAQRWLEMWRIAGFPAVDGVIAVSDQAVQDVFDVLGPITVQIEGESVTITGENIISVIESYRSGPGDLHKDAVRIIGTAMLERIKAAGLGNQREILDNVQASANRREIQIYAVNPQIQEEVVARGWDGALYPQPGVASFGVTIANVIGNKASANIQISANLDLQPQADGTLLVTAELELKNNGDPDGDQFYNGFHRTWLSVWLPPDATLVSSEPASDAPPMADDPRSIGFHVPLLTQETRTVTVQFRLPAGSEQLLLRRQSGANDVRVRLSGTGSGAAACSYEQRYWLDDDAVLDLTACTSTKVHAE